MSYDFIFVVLIECSERFCSQDVSTLLLEVLHLSVPSRCLRLFCLIWSSTTVAFSSSPSVFIMLLCTSLSDSRICHQQIYRSFAIYSRLSPANLPNICYWQSTVTSKFTEYLLLTVDYHQPLTRKVYITMFLVHLVQNCIIQLEKCKNMLKNGNRGCHDNGGEEQKNICIFMHHSTEVKNRQSFRKIYFFCFKPILTATENDS